MKTKSIVTLTVLFFSFLLFTSSKTIQEKETFEGIYDGKEDYGYNFIGIDEEGDEFTMTFHGIDETILSSFDFKSEKLVGSKFMVTYTTKTVVNKDEDGYEDEEEIYSIVALKKL